MVDPATFRDVMAQWPSGVTVVTTLDAQGERKGMTASSFSSVSLTPPLVSVCLLKTLYAHHLISDSGVFGVNVLAKDQQDVARRFAGMVPGVEDRFEGDSWSVAETGVSLLDDALGWVDCRVVHEYDGGDHTIFVGEVVAAHNARRSAPLLFHSRGWGQFADVLPDVATVADSGLVSVLHRSGLASEVPSAVSVVTGAGVRLRVASVGAGDDVDAVLAAVPWPADRSMTTVLVGDRLQAQKALEVGVGDVSRALAVVEGIADRVAVEFALPFGAGRRDAVLEAVELFSSAGVREICLPDAAGAATALEVRDLLQEVVLSTSGFSARNSWMVLVWLFELVTLQSVAIYDLSGRGSCDRRHLPGLDQARRGARCGVLAPQRGVRPVLRRPPGVPRPTTAARHRRSDALHPPTMVRPAGGLRGVHAA